MAGGKGRKGRDGKDKGRKMQFGSEWIRGFWGSERCGFLVEQLGVVTFFQTAPWRCVFLAVAQLFFVVPSDFVAFGGKNEGPVTPAPAALAGQLEPGQLGAELATNFQRWN
jgi:hypothetical protein